MTGMGSESSSGVPSDQGELYDALLRKRGIDAAQLRVDSSGTVGVASLPVLDLGGTRPPRLIVARPGTDDAGAHLTLQKRIGLGSAGVVWSSTQRPLDRRVAVKLVRPDRSSAAREAQLFREAVVAGALEHPNIAPVYALGEDQEGRLVLVMRYIDGQPWQRSMKPLWAEGAAADAATVEEQLGVLVSVCRAVEFAHSHGVIHRDLKPSNVMKGQFGEVYVVDWGIAVTTRGAFGLPPADGVNNIVGTPQYMAPEQAGADGSRIDERTDVYALGAILHELVTGTPRHAGSGLPQMLANAHASELVEYPVWVPADVAEVCNKATAKRPEDRYQSAAEFREAVLSLIRRQTARELTQEIKEQLRELVALIDETGEDDDNGGEIARLATSVRVGFRQILRLGDDAEARRGLDQLVAMMLPYELRRENLAAAESLLRELSKPRPDLRDRVRRLAEGIERRKSQMKDLARLRHAQDMSVSAERRRWASLLMGVVFTMIMSTLVALRVLGLHQAGYADALVIAGVFMVGLLIPTVLFRGEDIANAVTVTIRKMVAASAVLVFIEFALAAWLDVPFGAAVAMAFLILGFAATAMSFVVDRRLMWSGVAFVVSGIASAAFPDLRGILLAAGFLVALGWASVLFKQLARKAPAKATRAKA
jgi:serine/threonine-protein kinase